MKFVTLSQTEDLMPTLGLGTWQVGQFYLCYGTVLILFQGLSGERHDN